GRENPRDAVLVELVDLRRDDHAAPAPEHLDVRAAPLAQKVEHVLEELHVTALIRRNRDAVRVLLERGGDDLLDGAVVAQVDHFASARLKDPAHDVDRRIVAVEQARCRDEPHLVRRFDDLRLLGEGSVVHRRPGQQANPGEGKLTPTRGNSSLTYVYVNVNPRGPVCSCARERSDAATRLARTNSARRGLA